MSQQIIAKIWYAIKTGDYDMTHHAFEKMADDKLGVFDIETAVLSGQVVKIEKDDPRGSKYVINGVGTDQTAPIGVVGRFKETGIFLIITVYQIK
ncbi:MAG TPA: DUF4258 domain-containing protein [Candidatus Brocadiia bacterium]|nr:DUF4258 domain-containing protein [Planctomycetota bacterium]MDO8092752.1 DUF4258 domain-containing protein [Candidatus Brocadiales bacterium]